VSPELFDLIKKILVKDPTQRLTLSQMKNHKWFDDFEYKSHLTNALQEIRKFNEIDADIAAKMNLNDNECNLLYENLWEQSLDRNSITYRIFFKDKLTNFFQTLERKENSKIMKFKYFFKPKAFDSIHSMISYNSLSTSTRNSFKKRRRGNLKSLIISSQHAPILNFAYTSSNVVPVADE
jgi:serine/threonine protein kinase